MSIMTDFPRLAQVARFAQEHIYASAAQLDSQPTDPDYRWQHTLRVTHYGRQIAEAEGADIELAVAACLLHDSEKYSDWQKGEDERSHGRVAAQTARPFLAQIGYSPEQVDNICYSIAVHVDGSAGYEHEHTLEARVVSDADNVDRFGAYRVLLWCVDDMSNYAALIAKLGDRVQRLKDYRERQVMETGYGNHLFNQQLELQIDFFQKLIAEYGITHLPE